MNKLVSISLTLLSLLLADCYTTSNRIYVGEASAKTQLENALANPKVVMHLSKVKDKQHLIDIIEPVLFSIYGEENILKQKPYEIYFLNDYWIAMGTLPESSLGGTFRIIVKGSTGEVIEITHSK